jgi:hypothetical protein
MFALEHRVQSHLVGGEPLTACHTAAILLMTVNDGGVWGMHALAGHESWKERAP